jgi:hypothetical protein
VQDDAPAPDGVLSPETPAAGVPATAAPATAPAAGGSDPRATASGLPPGVTVISIRPMYSPGQATFATFLGGPLGGAWLLALNYQRLAQPGKARATIGVAVLATVAALLVAFALPGPTSPLAIGLVVAMHWIAKGLQGAAYNRHVALGGSVGSSWRAAGVGLLAAAITFSAIVGIALLDTPPEIVAGNGNVRYTGGATRAEAQGVGDELVAQHYGAGHRFSVELTRDRGRSVVELAVEDFVFSDSDVQIKFHELAEPLSKRAFGGSQVDIWLTDGEFKPHVKLTWESRPYSTDLGDRHVVRSQQGATEAEARSVAKVLEEQDYFPRGAPATVVVKRVSLRPVVQLYLRDSVFEHPEAVAADLRKLAEPLSRQAFDGRPVDIWLGDAEGKPRVKLSWESRPQ